MKKCLHRKTGSFLVSPEGFEPSTASLKGNCSTIELWALRKRSLLRVSLKLRLFRVIPLTNDF